MPLNTCSLLFTLDRGQSHSYLEVKDIEAWDLVWTNIATLSPNALITPAAKSFRSLPCAERHLHNSLFSVEVLCAG